MKSKFLSLSGYHISVRGVLLGFAFSLCGLASAQNRLQNPGFESPIGPVVPVGTSWTNNWAVAFPYGGPADVSIADRSTFARHTGDFGAHFRSVHDGLYHAYFTQTVTNLAPGAGYTVSGYMRYWEFTYELNDKIDVYFEAVGGLGTNSSPNITAMDDANAKTNSVYRLYAVTNTADPNGNIEVRLHMTARTTTCCDKIYYKNAMWDDMSLTLTP